MSALNSSVTLSTTLPASAGYTLDTIVANGSAAEFSQDTKFKLQASSTTYYDMSIHQYVTTYGLALTNVSTNASVTLASGSNSSYLYTSLSNFTVDGDVFYLASYLKGGTQLSYRVFDSTGATVMAETAIDTGSRIDSIRYDGLGALVLAYNNNTEFATLAFTDPDTPVAINDSATMKQDAVLKINVLANDTDPNGDTLSIASATVVSGSADVAVVNGKLTVDYTGAELWLDETAKITINYVASDGAHSGTGTLTVDVTDPFNRITGDATAQNIKGTAAREYTLAGAGDDHVYGGDASDILLGEVGNDVLRGGDGNDILIGGAGDDNFYAGSGNDILVGDDGAEFSFGEDGNDIIIDGAGNDVYFGDAGRDTFYDGAGNELYYGGAGADTFYFFSGAGTLNRIYEFDSQDKVRIDTDAAAGMVVARNTPSGNGQPYSVTLTLADGAQIIIEFEDKKDAKGTDWYETGDYSVPTDSHGLY